MGSKKAPLKTEGAADVPVTNPGASAVDTDASAITMLTGVAFSRRDVNSAIADRAASGLAVGSIVTESTRRDRTSVQNRASSVNAQPAAAVASQMATPVHNRTDASGRSWLLLLGLGPAAVGLLTLGLTLRRRG